jgi:putative DNA primase/helicase
MKHELIDQISIVDTINKYVQLEHKGAQHLGICPFHKDTTKSLHVNDGKRIFKCFACGASGDAIDFVMKFNNIGFMEAVNRIKDIPDIAPPPPVVKNTLADKLPTNYNCNFHHPKYGRIPDQKWAYHDVNGNIIGYACRFNNSDGTKAVLPYTFKSDNQWHWKGFNTPRPLYNLHLIKSAQNIIIVEGEKCADAVNKYSKKYTAISWIGGVDGIKHADFSPINNKPVIVWPDNDEPGIKAAQNIPAQNKKIMTIPADKPKKWDAADGDWVNNDIDIFIHSCLTDKIIIPEIGFKDQPFRILGFEKVEDKIHYVFYIRSSQQVVKFSAAGMTKNNLLMLADMNWWGEHFIKKQGFDMDAAINWLINDSHRAGVYEPDRMRGLGAWIDEGRAVVHAGNRLIVDGIPCKIQDHVSRYIYEARRSLDFKVENSIIDSTEGDQLIKMLELVNWNRPVSAYLLAGWCAVAPVCGALPWRPHIMLTGGAGTGKSWLIQNVIAPLLGNIGISVQGDTTSSGVRQFLASDARPIIFDEAEAENKKALDRMQEIYTLMRGSSVQDGGSVLKGSANGRAVEYSIKSCFAFAAIGDNMSQQADRSRVTILSIDRENDINKATESFTKLGQMVENLLDVEFCNRFRARIINLLPVLLDNCKTFSEAAALVLGTKRSGDQVGVLLAGAYALKSSKRVELDDAIKWVKAKADQWNEERIVLETKDENNLLNYILETRVQVETENFNRLDRTIGELIFIASGRNDSEMKSFRVTSDEANTQLLRIGIRVDVSKGVLYISNTAKGIHDMLRDTPFARNHAQILSRIKGATKNNTVRINMRPDRAVGIPFSEVDVLK